MTRILLAFAIVLSISCKKESIEKDSCHFMTSIPMKTTAEPFTMIVEYNNEPQQMIIAGDSVIVKRAGLYRFSGNIYVLAERTNAANPVVYDFTMTVPHLGQVFRLCSGVTTRANTALDNGYSDFYWEIFLEANSSIILKKNFNNASPLSPLVYGHFGGYRKGN